MKQRCLKHHHPWGPVQSSSPGLQLPERGRLKGVRFPSTQPDYHLHSLHPSSVSGYEKGRLCA